MVTQVATDLARHTHRPTPPSQWPLSHLGSMMHARQVMEVLPHTLAAARHSLGKHSNYTFRCSQNSHQSLHLNCISMNLSMDRCFNLWFCAAILLRPAWVGCNPVTSVDHSVILANEGGSSGDARQGPVVGMLVMPILGFEPPRRRCGCTQSRV